MVAASVNSTNTSTNTSCNSLADRCRGIERRVYQLIDASEVELRPAEIARKIHAPSKPTAGQYTTVRGFCSKLLQKGLVLQPYPGAYCNKVTYGVRFVPLCVHNISLQSSICQTVKHWEGDEIVGGVKIHVCFGSERRKVSGFIACDVGGMSHDACLLALNRWFDLVEGKLGFPLSDVRVTTFELNKDYHGVRVDGVSCITRSDLFGMVERVYQKEESLIRKERKVLTPMSINKFEEAVQKGVVDLERSQERFELQQEVKRLTEAAKFTNSRVLQVERLTEAVYLHLAKLPKLDEGTAQKLTAGLDRLNETLSRLGDAESQDPKQLAEGQRKLGEYTV